MKWSKEGITLQIAELQAMTVIQLRKLAKENGVKLSAGIDKAGIVEKVAQALAEKTEEPAQTAPGKNQESGSEADVTSVAPASGFRPWNQTQQEQNGFRPAYRQAWQARPTAAREPVQKPAWQRSANPANRFGPQSRSGQTEETVENVQQEPPRPAQTEPVRAAQENAPRLDGYRLGYRAAPQRQPYQNRSEYGARDQNYGGYQNRPYQQNHYNSGYQPRPYQPQGHYQQNGYQQGGYQGDGGYQAASAPAPAPSIDATSSVYDDDIPF